ncbi:MAG: chemotaxis protein CheA [Myxococcota bacterium]
MNSLAPTFIVEARELLVDLEDLILQLDEAKHDADLVNAVFRALHTLKGSGAAAGFSELERFAHRVETVVDAVRNGKRALDEDLSSTILRSVDHIKALLEADVARPPELVAVSNALIAELAASDAPAAGAPRVSLWWVRVRPHEGAVFSRGVQPSEEFAALGNDGPFAWRGRLTGPVPEFGDLTTATFPYEIIALWRGASPPDLAPLETWADVDVEMLARDVSLPEVAADDAELVRALEEASPGRLETLLGIQPAGAKIADAMVQGFREPAVNGSSGPVDTATSATGDPEHPSSPRGAPGTSSADTLTSDPVPRAAARPAAPAPPSAEPTFRVRTRKLDELVALVGELVILQNRLENVSHRLADAELSGSVERLLRLSHDLRDSAMELRMTPIESAFGRMKRVVRDTSTKLGKKVRLEITGGGTELDKNVIDRLHEPLIHLVRNALDHGIETPEMRAEAGKSPSGLITLSAHHTDTTAVVEVRDDGAGLDASAIRKKAVARGLLDANAEASDHELQQLIFEPGFSTAASVSAVSGRGVGMDAVKTVVRDLRGDLSVTSTVGEGTRVSIEIPLTLAIIEGLLIELGETPCIFPLAQVEECLEVRADDVSRGRLFEVRGEAVPYFDLASWFDLGTTSVPGHRRVVISRASGRRVGFVVDRVVSIHQTVVKSLGKAYDGAREVGIAGATILGSGRVALVLDPTSLGQVVGRTSAAAA